MGMWMCGRAGQLLLPGAFMRTAAVLNAVTDTLSEALIESVWNKADSDRSAFIVASALTIGDTER